MNLETLVKLEIYRTTADTGQVPKLASVARALELSRAEVDAACDSLQNKRLLVLDRGTGEIRMAPPFSAIPTPHEVTVGDKRYYANCIWDAFGVAAALGTDANIATVCADCGETLLFQVRDGEPVPQACVIHYAVPAAHWWDDIVYT